MTTCPTPHANALTCPFCDSTPNERTNLLVDTAEMVANREPEKPSNGPKWGTAARRTILRQHRACIEVYFRDKGAL